MSYLLSPADGGVVLQLPVTMSPKLEELPPVFLQKTKQNKKKATTKQHKVIASAPLQRAVSEAGRRQRTSASAPVSVAWPPAAAGWG